MNYSLNYIIRDDRVNGKGLCPIYLRYTFCRKWVNIPLKKSLEPIYWDKVNFNLNLRKKHPNFNELKKLMGDFEGGVRNKIDRFYLQNDVYPTIEQLTLLLKEKKRVDEKQDETSLKKLFDRFVEFKKSSFVELSTLTIYKTTWEKWGQFQKQNSVEYGIGNMNEKTLTEFVLYLLNEGLQKNTIGKYVKTIKSFLNFVSQHLEINVPQSYKRVKVYREEKYDFQVFSKEEFETLKSSVFYSRYFKDGKSKIDLSEREVLIGRIMVFLCSTGLSFVDFSRLTIDDIFVDKDILDTKKKFVNIKIHRQKLKTTEVCIIPIIDITIDLLIDMLGLTYQFYQGDNTEVDVELKMKILEKLIKLMKKGQKLTEYQPNLFPKIYVQDFNKEIKLLLKKIGMTTDVKLRKQKKGKIIESVVPKYSLISSHSGRRTYITSCLQQNIRPHILMKTTGHKKVGTLLRYNKETDLNIFNEFNSKINTKGSED